MALRITEWEDLAFFDEEVDDETGQFRHTSFAAFDAHDNAYFGKLNQTKSDITFSQLSMGALSCLVELTKAPDTLPPNTYVKHPNLSTYEIFQEHNVLNLGPKGLLEEARAMEIISQHPHPNIIHYHGCRVRRGRITGLVLDRHSNTLNDHLKNKVGSVDKEPFMQALISAIDHLHSLGWAHNDLNPGNILVDKEGMPVLIDFGSAREMGAKLGTSRGTKGWIEGEMKDYHMSDKRHDLFAIDKIRLWLDAPMFSD
ncbi:protein kinase [Metarhizium robertsii]|uniref:Protein kinase n=2 Tax=Metarhizium robertsii TaxID=568076 RepID=A0A014MUR8_9HYPO|nr:protein kinase [Metarhizium robertsii]